VALAWISFWLWEQDTEGIEGWICGERASSSAENFDFFPRQCYILMLFHMLWNKVCVYNPDSVNIVAA